jgi:two-component system sensor histidine kinase PilS (NtrC family)
MLSTLRRKLLWLIVGRAAVATLLLGAAPLIRERGGLPVDPFYALLGCTYILTIAYAMALRFLERYRWLVDVQLALDAVVVSGIVYLTGGIGSYFSSLYTLPIIAATTVESRRSGLMVGVLSCVLYGGLVLAQYGDPEVFERTTGLRVALPAMRVGLMTVGLNLFGFAAVAALSGYLAEGLRRADAQLKQASNQIEDLQAFSRHVIDSLTSGLATTDIDGRILTFNRAAGLITGIPTPEAVGQMVTDVLSLPADFHDAFGTSEERPRMPRMEFAFTRADGQQIELGLSMAPLVTPRGETGFLVTFQDVTETRKQEREARIQQRLAAVGEMAAGIAHEIRNPLASMAGSIQILRQELPLSADQSQLMDIVLRESERLNETIRSFLAFAKPQRQASDRVDVRRVVTDAARLLENSSELTAGHRIAVDVPPHEVWLEADEGQIRQIVWNLATNGLRAMPNGGRLTLAAKSRAGDAGSAGEVLLSVQDQGTGIAPEDLDGIFQPFRGAFSRGTGLGLSIVRRIIAEYGGEIQVTSERGSGTTVLVRFPLGRAAEPAAAGAVQVSTGKVE